MTRRPVFLRLGVLAVLLLTLGACTHVHVYLLAQDDLGGRVPGSAGHDAAGDYIADYLLAHGAEALDGSTDPASLRAGYDTGTNIVARIPGTDLADEIVLLGAHYDHVSSCADKGGSPVCNGATDNAAGTAILLEVAATIADRGEAPRRTIVLAFWDEEERGLRGSRAWVEANPGLVDDVVTHVNIDIAGANLLPSLAGETLAVGAETGGSVLTEAVADAGAAGTLDLNLVSLVFGQGRSDHAVFAAASVPTVFFTDSTGPCYHSTGDAYAVLDVEKLAQQQRITMALVDELASGSTTPTFDGTAPLATHDDAIVVHGLLAQGLADLDRFSPSDAADLLALEATLGAIVDGGPASFDADARTTLLLGALDLVGLLTTGECDGFLD